MKRSAKEEGFIKQPFYEGGNAALTRFIHSNLKYPEEALIHKISGVVELMLTINHEGAVEESNILSSLGHGCDEEAQRVASLVKFIVPKTPRKLKVIFHKRLRVQFKLPIAQKETPVPSAKPDKSTSVIQYQYTVPSSPKKQENVFSYTYTISNKK
ncbi:MAG: TonB family protein [Saprospiraceae bacterium]|nr:TonB family protein [Saprospiraceae bacterium]